MRSTRSTSFNATALGHPSKYSTEMLQRNAQNNASSLSNAPGLNRSVTLRGSDKPTIKFLPTSLQLMQACFSKHANLFMHLYHLACMMRDDNKLITSISDLAYVCNMKYGATSVAMRKLCNHQLIARTGEQFVWMINPYVVYKCSDVDLQVVQAEWKEYV